MLGAGADGVSVMAGTLSRVLKRSSFRFPFILPHHRAAHSVGLAAGSLSQNSCIKEVEEVSNCSNLMQMRSA